MQYCAAAELCLYISIDNSAAAATASKWKANSLSLSFSHTLAYLVQYTMFELGKEY